MCTVLVRLAVVEPLPRMPGNADEEWRRPALGRYWK
jgi:hypothetical protein